MVFSRGLQKNEEGGESQILRSRRWLKTGQRSNIKKGNEGKEKKTGHHYLPKNF